MRITGDQIAEEAAHLDAATHRLLTHVREFDVGNGWFDAGAQSCAHWLSWRVGWTLGTGREHVRVARRLAELPRIDDALRQGKLSYAKVRAITRVASAATEEALLVDAVASTGAQLEKICRKLRFVQRLSKADAHEVDQDRRVSRRELDDGMVRIEATLRPEEAALVMAAIEQQAKAMVSANAGAVAGAGAGAGDRPADVSAETRRPRFDRADALVAMAQTLLRGEKPTCVPIEVVVTVPRAALTKQADDCAGSESVENVAVFADGTCVSAETARRLACDCGVVEMVEDEHGNPLSVGRRTRTLPASLMRALLHRDATCRFPGCTNRVFLDGHHIKHWANGGETSLENTCLLCTRHHTFVHEHGYRIETVDGELVFLDPRGRRVPKEPPRLAPSSVVAWQKLEAENANLGITPTTNACRWDGQPVQYDLVVGGLARREGLGPKPSWSVGRSRQ